MINDELLSKFDSIRDLPVSEEMLGAYVEGRLDAFDRHTIEHIMASDLSIESFMSEFSIKESSWEAIMDPELEMVDFYYAGSDIFSQIGSEDSEFDVNSEYRFTDNDLSIGNQTENNLIADDSFDSDDHSLESDMSSDDDFTNDDFYY